jgi:peptide chain release factor 1
VKIQTSAASVVVMPEAEEVDVDLKPGDLKIDVFRSQGAGGQSVNTTESAVRITHLPTGIVVTMQDERSQIQNRAKAMQNLRTRIYDMERRKAADARKKLRNESAGTGDRSDKVRTYNFPQDRVTDHRVGLTVTGVGRVLSGVELERISLALQAQDQELRLNEFLVDLSEGRTPT